MQLVASERPAATENERSARLSSGRGTTMSLYLLAERFKDLPGIEEVVVMMFLRLTGARSLMVRCKRRQSF